MMFSALFILSVLAGASAQQVGTNTAETHPPVTVSKCTASGCTTSQQSIVLDANWRWVHTTTGYTNCYTGNSWNETLCPDGTTCAKNCAVDGADYASTYGITTTGNAVKLNFMAGTNVGSRSYLMAAGSTTQYQMFQLLNQELSFDVDVSNLGCGLNGAFYLSEMDADGGLAKYPTNKAGAKYGTGYCDAQCPQDLKFINGQANSANWTGSAADPNSGAGGYGSCCNEMDLWEANSISTAYTPHPCSVAGQTRCSGTDCGIGNRYASMCDADGCDFNSYRMGDTSFYGPGKTIDTTKPFTVVTQFITNDGTSTGTLSDIKRFYVQGGVTYANSQSKIAGVPGNSITGAFCDAQKSVFGDKTAFQDKGGLAVMGAALSKGMVLVMSIWDDHGAKMRWLDAPFPETADPSAPGVSRGTCAVDSGEPKEVEATQKGASVTYSNIKWGPINSTFASGSVSGGSPVPVGSTTTMRPSTIATSVVKPTTTATSVVKPTTSAPATGGAARYAQCGGIGWTGATTCAGGYACKASGPYYSQCL